MDILKLANEWAKAEIFSSKFFILFGLVFLAGSIGFSTTVFAREKGPAQFGSFDGFELKSWAQD